MEYLVPLACLMIGGTIGALTMAVVASSSATKALPRPAAHRSRAVRPMGHNQPVRMVR